MAPSPLWASRGGHLACSKASLSQGPPPLPGFRPRRPDEALNASFSNHRIWGGSLGSRGNCCTQQGGLPASVCELPPALAPAWFSRLSLSACHNPAAAAAPQPPSPL